MSILVNLKKVKIMNNYIKNYNFNKILKYNYYIHRQ